MSFLHSDEQILLKLSKGFVFIWKIFTAFSLHQQHCPEKDHKTKPGSSTSGTAHVLTASALVTYLYYRNCIIPPPKLIIVIF